MLAAGHMAGVEPFGQAAASIPSSLSRAPTPSRKFSLSLQAGQKPLLPSLGISLEVRACASHPRLGLSGARHCPHSAQRRCPPDVCWMKAESSRYREETGGSVTTVGQGTTLAWARTHMGSSATQASTRIYRMGQPHSTHPEGTQRVRRAHHPRTAKDRTWPNGGSHEHC